MKQRNDDFKDRREHLDYYNDEELKAYFFELTDQLVHPLLNLAFDYTSPAIERSVLMRMGFSSTEAKMITDKILEHQLLSHGAGHVVFRYAKNNQLTLREAGLKLMEGHEIDQMVEVFKHES